MRAADAARTQALFRLALTRLADPELVSSNTDFQGLIARAGGTLLALGLILTCMVVIPCWVIGLPAMVTDGEEFLISITLAAAGMASVLAWDSVLPSRQDSLILGVLPVRRRDIAMSRLMAVLTCIAAVVIALHVLIGLSFPYVLAHGFFDSIRCLGAWWITIFIAAGFVFAWMLALQGIAANVFSWHTFRRISPALQVLSLATVLVLFFITPSFTATMRNNPGLAAWLPSYWFTGLLHWIEGDSNGTFTPLALICLRNLFVVFATAGGAFALAWLRLIPKIVEAPDIAPGSERATMSRLGRWFANALFRHPLDRAMLLFTARTVARSHRHRLLLAIYGGVGFALVVTFSRSMFLWNSSIRDQEASALMSGALLLVSSVAAMRTVFARPHSLQANWSFRIAAVQHPARYFESVRRSMIVLAVAPACLLCTAAWLWVLPGRLSLEASAVLVLLGLILTHYSLNEFRRIPFACSWAPSSGQSTRSVKMMAATIGILLFAGILGQLQLWAIDSVARFVTLCAVLAVWGLWLTRRAREFGYSSGASLQFEESPQTDLLTLDLRPDGAWSNEQGWVDAAEVRTPRPLMSRLTRVAAILAGLAIVGVLYRQFGEWNDHRLFPQVGRSVDIGGRSLNIDCAGQGSPAVVMDSGNGLPGYDWVLVQRLISGFTRACWYDRAGYGWSDPAPEPRSAADTADDLHRLLNKAGIPPPYILAGHSAGGFNVRVFGRRYQGDTAGLVLVDSASENAEGEITAPRAIQSPATQLGIPDFVQSAIQKMVPAMAYAGLPRLLDPGVSPAPRGFTSHDWQMIHVLQLQAKSIVATIREGRSRHETVQQVRAVKNLGNMPVVVLTAAKRFPPPLDDPEQASLLDAYYRYRVHKDQPRMLKLSPRSRQIILEDTGHNIPEENPQAVAEAVKWVLNNRELN